jgi:DNA-binding MarR family transcriptional regulator
MKVEQAIKQKLFKNQLIKLEVNLLYTASLINNYNTKYFRSYQISPQQYNVLRILRGSFPKAMNMNVITQRMIDKMSNATRLVDKLVLKGLVNKKTNEYNRRQVDILITQIGLNLLLQIDNEMDIIFKKYAPITEQEAEQINILLDKLNS